MEWNVSSGGNSGIFWAIQEDSKYAEPYQTGPEIQILDNHKHPDGKILTISWKPLRYDTSTSREYEPAESGIFVL